MKLIEQACQAVSDHIGNRVSSAIKCLEGMILTAAQKGDKQCHYYNLDRNYQLNADEMKEVISYFENEGFETMLYENGSHLYIYWRNYFTDNACPQCHKFHTEVCK